jgi:hypothetical protein
MAAPSEAEQLGVPSAIVANRRDEVLLHDGHRSGAKHPQILDGTSLARLGRLGASGPHLPSGILAMS